MWDTIKDRIAYATATAVFCAVGLAIRYATHWAPAPTDPLQRVVFILGQERPHSTSPNVLERNSESVHWEVAYATQHSFSELDGDYTGPDTELHFGLTEVSLPVIRSRGSLDLVQPQDESTAGKITRSADRGLKPDDFYTHIATRLAAAEQRDLLIFVHGYNVSFNESVCRIAQMAEDMPFSGVVLAYDWKSQSNEIGYFQDKWTTGTTHAAFAGVLAELRERLDPDVRIHVLAHSMGNRYTLNALQLLGNYEPYIGMPVNDDDAFFKPQFAGWRRWHPRGSDPKPIANLIFAAPDVSPEAFQEALGTVSRLCDHMTLYCNEADFALEFSRYINGQGKHGFRVGDSRSEIGVSSVDIIRLQEVSPTDPFGHSYYGSHPGLLSDLSLLLEQKASLELRPTVTAGQWPYHGNWYLR